MASTSTWPLLSPAIGKPHRIDFANESSTDLRSRGLALLERNDMFGCTSMTRGPMRWNETIFAPAPDPRSSPMSFEPRPAARPIDIRNSVSSFGISRKSEPVRSSQYIGK